MPYTVRPKSPSPTARQIQFLRFITEYQTREERPPAIRDFVKSRKLKITSTSVVNYFLVKLEENGYIRRQRRTARGLRLTAKGKKVLTITPN